MTRPTASFPLALLVALTAVSAPAAAQVSIPLAVVDSRRVLQAAPGLDNANRQLQSEVDAMSRATQLYADSIRDVAAPLQKEAKTATPKRQNEIANIVSLLQAGITRRVAAADSAAEARRAGILEPFLVMVRDAIEAERAAMHVGMVFRIDADDTLLSSAPALDITDRVLARIRGMRPPAN